MVAAKAGYKRITYYAHIKQSHLELDILKRYAKALNHDFSNEIPEMKDYHVSEPEDNYLETPSSIAEATRQRDYFVKLYLAKLEEIRKLEEELKHLKDKA